MRIALKEIDDEAYSNTLRDLLEEKLRAVSGENVYVVRDKLSKYAIQKGYEPELVWGEIRALLP